MAFSGGAGYETGTATLQAANMQLFVFCTNDISLNPSNFHTFSRILVVASVDWSLVQSNINKDYAAAAQTVVNGTSFKACAHLTGVVPTSVALPRLNWIAVQINVPYRTNRAITTGFIVVDSNTTGASLCKKMEVKVK